MMTSRSSFLSASHSTRFGRFCTERRDSLPIQRAFQYRESSIFGTVRNLATVSVDEKLREGYLPEFGSVEAGSILAIQTLILRRTTPHDRKDPVV